MLSIVNYRGDVWEGFTVWCQRYLIISLHNRYFEMLCTLLVQSKTQASDTITETVNGVNIYLFLKFLKFKSTFTRLYHNILISTQTRHSCVLYKVSTAHCKYMRLPPIDSRKYKNLVRALLLECWLSLQTLIFRMKNKNIYPGEELRWYSEVIVSRITHNLSSLGNLFLSANISFLQWNVYCATASKLP